MLISWSIICMLVLIIAVGNALSKSESEPGEPDPIGVAIMKIQARYIIGAQAATGQAFYGEARRTMNLGTVPQRLRFVVLAGEMHSPKEALDVLADLDRRIAARQELDALAADDGSGEPPATIEYSPTEREVREALEALYIDYDNERFEAPSLSDDQARLLRTELDWFGELALAPEQDPDRSARRAAIAPALRVFYTAVVMLITLGGIGLLGLFGLLALLICALVGYLSNRIGPALQYDHLYIETFALWLIVFLALGVVAELIPTPPQHALAFSAAAFFLSLIVLAWPVIRGVSFGMVRRDIGWTLGRAHIGEPFIGIAGYAMTLPLLAVGVGIMLLIIFITGGNLIGGGAEDLVDEFGPTGGPAHPIITQAASGGVWLAIQLYLVASIAAPIVEETMFRGVLYRHLRSISARMGIAGSIIISALLNSFIFAVIHPQGLIAVPALMGLAIGMTILREWRGTLIPSMVIHGVSNGIVMTMLLVFVA